MRWKSGFAFALMLGASLPAAAQETAGKTLDQLAPEIDALFAGFQTDQHVPGVVYGVVKDSKLAYVKGIGVQNIADKRPVTSDASANAGLAAAEQAARQFEGDQA